MPSSLFLPAAAVVLAATVTAWPLVKLTDTQAKDKGAVCLDGSNPAFYYGPAKVSDDSTKWVLYFKGGGWCYDEQSCISRSKGSLGSTNALAESFEFGGVTSDDPNTNPLMAGWNHVVLWYCDGASFSGDKTEPYMYNSSKGETPLYFRGRRVLDAVLDTLLTEHGLDKATEVLLSGGSAGGLSTYLHADYVGAKLPKSVERYKAAPNSGFFSLHQNSNGESLYPDQMKYVYNMQNSSGGVNANCAAALAGTPDAAWKCIFANFSYAHSDTPMFPLQSSLDSWQMSSIWQGDKGCVASRLANCTADEIRDLEGYRSDMLDDYTRTAKFRRAGEGGFLETCIEHVAAQGAAFDIYAINGVKEDEAFIKWWKSDGEPAADHWSLPCELSEAAPHQCNPSCDSKGYQELAGCDPDDLMCQ